MSVECMGVGDNQPKIAVLLSTFNGERWLPELMQSLADQSLPFELIWRDDGSSDDSKRLVRDFGWLKLTEIEHSREGENVGACASFGRLMEAALSSDAELFFFADQDDVWRYDKLSKISATFEGVAEGRPHLTHHDLRVVSKDGVEISSSLWRYMRLSPHATELRHYLTRNSATGCAVAVNRPLLDLSCPVPAAANMHDWWLALIASAVGDIEGCSSCLVDYRQHGANALGAKSPVSGLNPLTNWCEGWQRGNAEFRSLFPQAAALLKAVGPWLGKDDRDMLTQFSHLRSLPLVDRLVISHRMGLRDRNVFFRIIAMFRVAVNPEA